MATVKTYDGRELTPRQVMEEVQAHILAEPAAYDQENVCMDDRPSCNTPACVAGWMSHVVFGHQIDPYQEVHRLVFGERIWPWLFQACWDDGHEDLCRCLHNAKTSAERAQVAVEAINCYMQEMGI